VTVLPSIRTLRSAALAGGVRPPPAVLACALAAAVAGCAPAAARRGPALDADLERRVALSAQMRARMVEIGRQVRADRVMGRLLRVLPDDVGADSTTYAGFRLADPLVETNAVLAEAVGARDAFHPFVWSLDPTGAAVSAGLRLGDQVVAVDGAALERADALATLLSHRAAEPHVRVQVLRDARAHTLVLPRRFRAPQLQVVVLEGVRGVNAFADRRGVALSGGLMAFLRSDAELAVVLGHEIGHLVLGHLSASYLGAGYTRAFSRDLEREADRWGLELAHAAGYDPLAGVEVWARFGRELAPAFTNELLYTHPPSRERMRAARRVAERLGPIVPAPRLRLEELPAAPAD
jgi:hypothetical protein